MLVFQAKSCQVYQTIECMVEITVSNWWRKVWNSTCCLLHILKHLLVLHHDSLHFNLSSIHTRPFPPLRLKALRWLTQEIVALNGAISLTLLWQCYHCSWWSISLIHLYQNGIQLQHWSFLCPSEVHHNFQTKYGADLASCVSPLCQH